MSVLYNFFLFNNFRTEPLLSSDSCTRLFIRYKKKKKKKKVKCFYLYWITLSAI